MSNLKIFVHFLHSLKNQRTDESQRLLLGKCTSMKKKKLNFLALAIEIFPGHAFSSNILNGERRRLADAECSARYIDFLKEKRGA